MRWKLAGIAVLSLLVGFGPSLQASATALDGTGLLRVCGSPDSELMGFCHGYIQGIHDGIRSSPDHPVCAPETATRADATVDPSLLRPPALATNPAGGCGIGAVVAVIVTVQRVTSGGIRAASSGGHCATSLVAW